MHFTAAPRPVVRSVIWDRGGVPRQLLPCPRMASVALPASSWSMCRCLWCDLVALRRTQAQPRAEPPILFELREHHRPPRERDPAECHREPSAIAACGPHAGGAADEGRAGGGCRCREHTSAVGRRIEQSFLDPCIALRRPGEAILVALSRLRPAARHESVPPAPRCPSTPSRSYCRV